MEIEALRHHHEPQSNEKQLEGATDDGNKDCLVRIRTLGVRDDLYLVDSDHTIQPYVDPIWESYVRQSLAPTVQSLLVGAKATYFDPTTS